jgi:hypothetical protein
VESKDGKEKSLADILYEHTDNPDDISVDFLDVFVDHSLFHRSDKFQQHKKSSLKKLFHTI